MGSFLIVNLQMRRALQNDVTARQPGLSSSVEHRATLKRWLDSHRFKCVQDLKKRYP